MSDGLGGSSFQLFNSWKVFESVVVLMISVAIEWLLLRGVGGAFSLKEAALKQIKRITSNVSQPITNDVTHSPETENDQSEKEETTQGGQ